MVETVTEERWGSGWKKGHRLIEICPKRKVRECNSICNWLVKEESKER